MGKIKEFVLQLLGGRVPKPLIKTMDAEKSGGAGGRAEEDKEGGESRKKKSVWYVRASALHLWRR